MGLSTSTTSRASLLCATCKARTTCTTTLLRSLEGPGGAFDTPKAKCPPDRGSSDWVTGSPASSISSISTSPTPSTTSQPVFINRPTHAPQHSQSRSIPSRSSSQYSTPPLTPDDGSEDSTSISCPAQERDALDFLVTLFPRGGLSALPHSKAVSISSPNLGSEFNGVVLDLPGLSKTLYVDGKSAESVSLRESIVALLDLADESLGCSALVIVLERSSPNLKALLHSLMYVGGTVVTRPPFDVDPAFILVGLEI